MTKQFIVTIDFSNETESQLSDSDIIKEILIDAEFPVASVSEVEQVKQEYGDNLADMATDYFRTKTPL